MGLFDLFPRKPKDPLLPSPSADDNPEPRCDHYGFAHYALRSVAFDRPLETMAAFASPDAERFLGALVEMVAEQCQGQPGAGLTVGDLKVHAVRAAGRPCAVLEMPPPRGVTEAHFVALVLQWTEPLPETEPMPKDALRYFTLERGVCLGGPPRTVLCEWTAEGSHRNFGDGPEPRLESFLEAVARLLERNG